MHPTHAQGVWTADLYPCTLYPMTHTTAPMHGGTTPYPTRRATRTLMRRMRLAQHARTWAVAITVATGLCVGTLIEVPTWGAPTDTHPTLPTCATEDSDNCYWDATERGNGKGRSFTVVDGVVTYR